MLLTRSTNAGFFALNSKTLASILDISSIIIESYDVSKTNNSLSMANISPFFKLIFSAIFVISRFKLFASLSILYFSELPTAPIDSKLSISSFSLLIKSNNSFFPAT